MQTAISLGSNLGDRLGTMRQALLLLQEQGIRITAKSDVFETAPQGETNQPRFLNACVVTETEYSPPELLQRLLAIEEELGRIRRYHWGPREIDLDILLMGDLVVKGEDIVLPHPRMHQRAFVLTPLSQILPDWEHPVLEETVETMSARTAADGIIRITTL